MSTPGVATSRSPGTNNCSITNSPCRGSPSSSKPWLVFRMMRFKQRRLRRHCEVNYDRFFSQHSPKRSRKSPSPWKMSNLKNILAASKTDKKVEKGIIYSPSQERKWSPKVIQYTIARIYQARLNELSKGSPGSRSKSVPYVKALRFDLFVVNWFKGTYGNTNRSVRMILSTFKL